MNVLQCHDVIHKDLHAIFLGHKSNGKKNTKLIRFLSRWGSSQHLWVQKASLCLARCGRRSKHVYTDVIQHVREELSGVGLQNEWKGPRRAQGHFLEASQSNGVVTNLVTKTGGELFTYKCDGCPILAYLVFFQQVEPKCLTVIVLYLAASVTVWERLQCTSLCILGKPFDGLHILTHFPKTSYKTPSFTPGNHSL